MAKAIPADFDNRDAWLGAIYSRPGGLRENVELLVEDAWIRQVEGPSHAYPYLDEYSRRLAKGKTMPLLVDILNCSHGCNRGSATGKTVTIDDADLTLNTEKRMRKAGRGEGDEGRQKSLFGYFDAHLRLEDFIRQYTAKPVTINTPTETELARIFSSMRKETETDKTIDCSACGYETCREMAVAIFNGINARENCIRFNQAEIRIEAENIRDKVHEIEELSGYTNRVVDALDMVAALDLTVTRFISTSGGSFSPDSF